MINLLKYTIQLTAAQTGLTVHTIRAWERRYHAVSPKRTPANQRYYTQEDIHKLSLLKLAVEQGHKISSVAGLSAEDLTRLTDSAVPSRVSSNTPAPALTKAELFLNQCLTYITELNPTALENILNKASAELDRDSLINNMVVPLIHEIGNRWYNGSLGIAHEHMAAAVLTGFIQKLKNIYNNFQTGKTLITACPQGQQHELGALLAALTAASLGWRVVHLGANLPAREIITAVNTINPAVLCLSLVFAQSNAQTTDDLIAIREAADPSITIIAGGRNANIFKDTIDEKGMLLIQDLNLFKEKLTGM